MSVRDEFLRMISQLRARFDFPRIADIFVPPFPEGGQRKDAQFMALVLEGGACGISYVLVPEERKEAYEALDRRDFIGKDPGEFALEFGGEDPVKETIRMAAVNAICQYVMKETHFPLDKVTDSLGLLSVRKGDRIGMVGLFFGLTETIKNSGAELVVIERKESLIQRHRDLPITRDVGKLATCNKIVCTSATVLNHSLDEVLSHCSPEALVLVIGPTAGYFPDPLFACGVDVVGGRVVENHEAFLQRLAQRKRWRDATSRTCFQKQAYRGIID